MAIQPAICSNCQGAINVDDVDLNGYAECIYCHTPHRIIYIITVDVLPTAKALLFNADNALRDGNLEIAVQ